MSKDAQNVPFYLSLATLVAVHLIWSLVAVGEARPKVDTGSTTQELEALKIDNAKLDQMLKDLNQVNEGLRLDNAKYEQMLKDFNKVNEDLKRKLQRCESKSKAKDKPRKADEETK